MTAHLSLSEQLDLNPTAALALFTQPDHLRAIMLGAGSVDPVITVTQHGSNSWKVSVERTFNAEWPAWLKSFVADGLRIAEERTWTLENDALLTGTMELRIHGQPVSMHGNVLLKSEGAGSHLVVEADVRAAIPLLGSKIESEVRTYLAAGIQHEIREFNKLA